MLSGCVPAQAFQSNSGCVPAQAFQSNLSDFIEMLRYPPLWQGTQQHSIREEACVQQRAEGGTLATSP